MVLISSMIGSFVDEVVALVGEAFRLMLRHCPSLFLPRLSQRYPQSYPRDNLLRIESFSLHSRPRTRYPSAYVQVREKAAMSGMFRSSPLRQPRLAWTSDALPSNAKPSPVTPSLPGPCHCCTLAGAASQACLNVGREAT